MPCFFTPDEKKIFHKCSTIWFTLLYRTNFFCLVMTDSLVLTFAAALCPHKAAVLAVTFRCRLVCYQMACLCMSKNGSRRTALALVRLRMSA